MSRGPDGHFRSDAVLRDAAVDPHPVDFPGVPNAGQADAHGPDVVATEVGTTGFDAAVERLRALEAEGKTWAER